MYVLLLLIIGSFGTKFSLVIEFSGMTDMRGTLFKLVLVGLHKIIFGHLVNLGDAKSDSPHRDRGNRITKGEEAVLEEFPFLVQFLNHGGLCAGTILTTKTVMTAAHCLDANSDLNEMIVFSRRYCSIILNVCIL